MLLGIAIEHGLVADMGVTVGELLPDLSPTLHVEPRKREITLEELVTMSSCLECDDWNASSPGNEERMYPREDWARFALDLPIRGDLGFRYCTAGVVLAGIAMERAVGEPLSAFAQRELFEPLGIERAEWPVTPLGQTATAGGLLLTSRALLSLGELYLRGGAPVLPLSWVEESTRPHARIDEETEYGYLWWLRAFAGQSSFYMTGYGGSRVHVLPTLDAVAVITAANFGSPDAHELSDRLLVEQIIPLVA
jgi:CubicO group peptidase (beta-lactamase class C family)